MDEDAVWGAIERERLRLADLLEGLTAADWEAPTLCEGWRVRDLAAHLTIATRMRLPTMVLGVLRAGGDPNRFIADDARRRATRPRAQLVEELRAVASSRRHPMPTKPMDPLVDALVHGQDIALPLGIDLPMPGDAAAAGATHVWRSGFPFHARKRVAGYRLVATDTDWSEGEDGGDVVEAPIERLLLVLTGRLSPAVAPA